MSRAAPHLLFCYPHGGAARLQAVLGPRTCNQHPCWSFLMVSFTVPFFSGMCVFSLCSFTLCLPLLLVLDMDILLRNVPVCSQSCHSQFLEPSYMSTIIYSDCSLELSYSPPSLRIAVGPSVHILLARTGNTEFIPPRTSPTVCRNHWVTLPLWDFSLETQLLASLPRRQYVGCSAS